jgi:UDP-glucose 6-dehydrogenase
MANDFEERGFDIIRYDLDKYKNNKEEIKKADIVFVAVPTPSIKRKFDSSILEEAIQATAPGQKVVIKSTVIPGTTDRLQKQYPDRYFFHSAEFLTEKKAKDDTKNPSRNVIGSTEISKHYAQDIMSILPKSIEIYCTARQSEL